MDLSSDDLAPAVRLTLLLAAMDHPVPRDRLEGALVLLGEHAGAVDAAMTLGLLRVMGDRVEVVSATLARRLVAGAPERERRRAHLALACAALAADGRYDARAVFDRLGASLDDASPAEGIPRKAY